MPSTPQAAIGQPAAYVTLHAIAFADANGTARRVRADQPLPVAPALAAAVAAPLAGTLSGTAQSAAFAPDLGRPIWLTLSGGWTGGVQVMRSVDGGATLLPITAGGQPWGAYTGNAQEPIGEETVAGATWYVTAALSAGTVGFRVQQ